MRVQGIPRRRQMHHAKLLQRLMSLALQLRPAAHDIRAPARKHARAAEAPLAGRNRREAAAADGRAARLGRPFAAEVDDLALAGRTPPAAAARADANGGEVACGGDVVALRPCKNQRYRDTCICMCVRARIQISDTSNHGANVQSPCYSVCVCVCA